MAKDNYKDDKIDTTGNPIDYVANLAGPPLFNQIKHEFKNNKSVKLYPNTYFYPIHYSSRLKIKDWSIPTDATKLNEETHLIHHFAASWYKQK